MRCAGKAGTDRPLAQLKILERSGTLVAEVGDRLVAPDGQLLLEFGRQTDVAARRPGPDRDAGSAADWLGYGRSREEEERFEEAAEAYRAALRLEPRFAEAHFNLGNVLRAQGRPQGAEERYRMALEQNPQLSEAWYNLADLLEATGRLDEAVECLRRALDACPTFADAHFNMAHCCERLGRETEASAHWTAYVSLDPDSEWAEIARQRLSSGG